MGEIGRRIRIARKDAGLSQEALARRAGMSLNGMASIERGEISDPHISTLSNIAEGLGVSVSTLLEEPILTSGKEPAPTSSREDRCAEVEEYSAIFRNIYESLRGYAEAAQAAGDTDEIAVLLFTAKFTNVGILKFIKEELAPIEDGSQLAAMHSAVLRLNILCEDLQKALEEASEEVPAPVAHLSEYIERRAAG
jgi:transcriptional regulator with XRE-family HTH domain